jgi:hypothetical protein
LIYLLKSAIFHSHISLPQGAHFRRKTPRCFVGVSSLFPHLLEVMSNPRGAAFETPCSPMRGSRNSWGVMGDLAEKYDIPTRNIEFN